MPGPNDRFVSEVRGGVPIVQQGLGPDEPTEVMRRRMLERAADDKAKEAALAQLDHEKREEARSMEQRKAKLDAWESELAERQRALDAIVGVSGRVANPPAITREDAEAMSYGALVAAGKARGIATHQVSKDNLIAALVGSGEPSE